jgi:hypothetical protein
MMADNQLLNDNNDGGDDDDVFVYTGGEQEVPFGVKRVRIAENVDTIAEGAFYDCELIEVVGHNRLKKIEREAFSGCWCLRWVKQMTGLIEIEEHAFDCCTALSDIDFTKLEIIGYGAFIDCESLKSINMPSIKRIGEYAFRQCDALTDLVFGTDLERIDGSTFFECTALRSITIPLKDNLIIHNTAFNLCDNLSRVDTLAGVVHNTISSLHMESWRNEMEDEIDSINQTLPNTPAFEKAEAIQRWVARVIGRIEHYKSEHLMLLKEAMTLLELTLWKTKLLNETDEKKCNVDEVTKNTKIDTEVARKEHRVTCGASIVIKNVLPFLALK